MKTPLCHLRPLVIGHWGLAIFRLPTSALVAALFWAFALWVMVAAYAASLV